jgi:hypothetical protein
MKKFPGNFKTEEKLFFHKSFVVLMAPSSVFIFFYLSSGWHFSDAFTCSVTPHSGVLGTLYPGRGFGRILGDFVKPNA